jgi:hypothetical protein
VRRNDEPQAENANYYTQGSQGGLNALSQPEQRQGQTTQQDDTQQDGMSSGGIPTLHIYEHHPLDKPILQYSTYQFRDWQLSDNYGDNALFRLHDGKLIFAGSPTDNNFQHFDFEAPSDRDRNNIYELEFFTTDTNGARITNRLNIKVNDLVNETTNPGQGRLLQSSKPSDEAAQRLIHGGAWSMPSSGPLVLKWAIQIADDLITRVITDNIAPANYESEKALVHTGTVLIARYVTRIRKYMSEAMAELEKLINVRFVEIGNGLTTADRNQADSITPDILIKVQDIFSGDREGLDIGGRVSGFPFYEQPHTHGHGDHQHDHDSNHRWISFRTQKIDFASNLEYLCRHELGHILGLKHPWDGLNGRPFTNIREYGQTPQELQTRKEENFDYTIMAYNSTIETWQPADILALQHLYGRPGEAAPARIREWSGEPQAIEEEVVDHKPSIFAFLDGVTKLLTTELSVLIPIANWFVDWAGIKILTLDDGRGTNKITIPELPSFLALLPYSNIKSFVQRRVTKNTTDTPLNDIPLTGTPLQYHVHLEASGDGPSLAPLTLKILTYRLTREGDSVGEEISVDHQAQSASFKWYLGVGEENIVVSRDAAFTPYEPGNYGLELTLNGVVGHARWTYVTWREGVYREPESTDGDDLIELGPHDRSGIGRGGDDYINAGETAGTVDSYSWYTTGLWGGAGNDVLVAGSNPTAMSGGFTTVTNPGNDVFLVYRGQSPFADKTHLIADFVPTHDKIGLGYEVTHVWYKQTDDGIYLLNGDGADAEIYALILVAGHRQNLNSETQPIITGAGQLDGEHFNVLGQTVTVAEYAHDVYRKNQLHNWVVDNSDGEGLKDESLVTLKTGTDFQVNPWPGTRWRDEEIGALIDLDDATQVWFEVRNVDNDEYLETILYKAEDKSEIFGVLDNYDWRPSSPDSPVLTNYFVDNTIEVIDLDPVGLNPPAPEML